MAKVIKSQAEYDAAFQALQDLMNQDPEPGTRAFEQMELLVVLLKAYETKKVQFDLPDPITAIRFRMDQQNLRQRDLVPYFGSRSRVSEVLSGKRGLSLTMARALHTGLGIPATVLLQQPEQFDLENSPTEWERFPVKEMASRGWLAGFGSGMSAQELLHEFFAPLGSAPKLAALYRSSAHVRSARTMDTYALLAWSAQVVRRTIEDPPAPYIPGTVNLSFLRRLASISTDPAGPRLAVDFLRRHGVSLIIEPHLPGTYLDGAALMLSEHPIVGLTIRHDRLDNFWFTLMHELAHIALHANTEAEFFDDLEVDDQGDPREAEADELAGEALIPAEEWRRSPASRLRTPEAAQHLADKLDVHVAIIAGKMRFESDSYKTLSHMVGHGEVRRLFPNSMWS